MSNTFSSLRTNIQNDIQGANSVIKSAVDAINKVNPFGDISAPQINVPSLDALQNVCKNVEVVEDILLYHDKEYEARESLLLDVPLRSSNLSGLVMTGCRKALPNLREISLTKPTSLCVSNLRASELQ